MKRLLLLFAPVMLSGCGVMSDILTAPTPPAPLAQTVIDDQAVVFGYQALDTTLTVVDALVATGAITPGSVKANRIADIIDTTRDWLNAAAAAQKVGQAHSYREAMANAKAALAKLKTAIGGPA